MIRMSGGDWSDEENDALVSDYFDMFADEETGSAVNKTAHRNALLKRIGRTKGSIEFKHQNVSAVLLGFGQDWLPGYRPASNFQDSLTQAVWRWLERHPEWRDRLSSGKPDLTYGVAAASELWIAEPPSRRNAPPPIELDKIIAVSRRFDVAERDARNRALGRAGEQLVLRHERTSLSGVGREDLADRVRWVSDLDGDGAGYDIASFRADGSRRLIEVKTTNGWEYTPFHISRNEYDVGETNPDVWRLVRVWNFRREPSAFELSPPLANHLALTPASFLATFD
jgi:hypothetical protein